MNIKRYLGAALIALSAQACMAQSATHDVITSSGGYFQDVSSSLSWTLGEPLIETGSSANNFLTQGFQQPSGIIIASVGNANDSKGKISAFPNPAISSVYITNSANQPLRVDVMDLTGQKLFTKNLTSNDDNEVNMTDYANGIYLFRVYSTDGKLLQTLKIDKIK